MNYRCTTLKANKKLRNEPRPRSRARFISGRAGVALDFPGSPTQVLVKVAQPQSANLFCRYYFPLARVNVE